MALSFLKEKNVKDLQIKKKHANELKYTFFLELFKPILDLEANDKLAIDNTISSPEIQFKLYLDKYSVSQSFRRWYFSQKREEIFKKLDILFDEYNKYIKDIHITNISTAKIMINISKLNKQLITKLLILKTTYNDINVNNFIDNYIKILSI